MNDHFHVQMRTIRKCHDSGCSIQFTKQKIILHTHSHLIGKNVGWKCKGGRTQNNRILAWNNEKSRSVSRVLYDQMIVGSHSSRISITENLQQPTQIQRGPRSQISIWSCSRWGLPCRCRCRQRGALLPHHFTLTLGVNP